MYVIVLFGGDPGSTFCRAGQGVVHNLLGFGHDGLQVFFIAETLGINLIDTFRAEDIRQ
jgi:hypothetical protein